MSSLESKRLARLQTEADRARRQLTPNGLATCAGMDAQGRILITQGGTTRPLDQYQSNAGAAYGQPLEVSDGFGMVTPRRPAPALETNRRIKQATWWALMQVDAGASWQYWLGGNLQEPIQVFSVAKQIPGCPATAYLYAAHYADTTSYTTNWTLSPTPAQLTALGAAWDQYQRLPVCQYLQIMGETHLGFSSYYYPNLGPGPFTVNPGPTGAGPTSPPPYFLPQVTAQTNCGPVQTGGYFEVTGSVAPSLPGSNSSECQVYFSQGYWRVRAHGKGRALYLFQDVRLAGPYPNGGVSVISSYPIAALPRSTDPSTALAIVGRTPYARLQHTRQCADQYPQPYTFDQARTVTDGQSTGAAWPQFPVNPNPNSESLYGTNEFFFISNGGVEWDFATQTLTQGSFPVVVEKRTRGEFGYGTLVSTIRAQAQQRWVWPAGVMQAIGYVV